METREPKEDDDENVRKAISLILKVISLNEDIEPQLWTTALISTIAGGYFSGGSTYKVFYKEMQSCLKFYKSYWKDQ